MAAGYRTIPFPFDELTPPICSMTARWTLAHLINYLRTWSATQNFIRAQGYDPLDAVADELLPLWGSPNILREISWPLGIRIGRV